jgi:hypothetical protein
VASYSLDHPLMPVVGQWLEKIQKALDFKNKRFGEDAKEGMAFFAGPYDFLYGRDASKKDRHFRVSDEDDESEIPAPKFRMTFNKVAELVQIFGPVLYHRNPIRQVNPREFPLPDGDLLAAFGTEPGMQMYLQQIQVEGSRAQAIDRVRGRLLAHYLNWSPTALDLKTESRWAIDEALIKGMGNLWTEVYNPPGGGAKMVGSFYDSVDNLVIDPDMPTLRAAKWIARRRCEPVWETERKFGLPEGTLRGNLESLNRQGEVDSHPDGNYFRARGDTNDLCVYWEVFSKTGLGGRLPGVAPWIRQPLEAYGDYCYLALCRECSYPLNVPSQMFDLPEQQATQQIWQRVQWPTPYWADDDWPFTPLSFHDIPNDPWPMSHLSPAMGELKFLNWAFSFIAGKIRITSRDFVAVLEEAGEELKEAVLHGSDLELIRIKGSHGKTIDQIVQFLQHPPFQGDIWRVIEAVMDLFDKRVGLSEMM